MGIPPIAAPAMWRMSPVSFAFVFSNRSVGQESRVMLTSLPMSEIPAAPVAEIEVTGPEIESALSALVPEDRHLGPAMKALSDRQRLYVVACVDAGCWKNHTKAARLAGYTGSEGSLKVQGYRLSHNPKVQAALLEEAKKRMQAATVGATNFVVELMQDEKADAKLRLKASESILDRGGVHAVREHLGGPADLTPEGRAEKILRIAVLAKLLGQDPRVLLGNVVDALPADMRLLESKQDAAPDAGVTLGAESSTAAPAAATE